LVEDVKMLCTEMAIMNQGKILSMGKPQDFIKNLEGKLWQKSIQKSDLQDIEANYQVISRQYSMGNLSVTIQANQNPMNDFEAVTPSLEDAYFSTLNHAK
jgi:ABC-2 type transport system ATP-binding protein